MTDTNPAPPPTTRPGGGLVPWVISLALAAVVGAVLFIGGFLAGGGAGWRARQRKPPLAR